MSLASREGAVPDRRHVRPLFRILAAGIVLTTIHYTDNYLYFDEYPQPGSLRPWQVYTAWLVLTAVGLAGYRLYKRGHTLPAYVCLVVYSYTGLSSLGHYLYGALGDFSAKQHVFILVDGLTGASVVAFVVWSAVSLRRGRDGSTPAVGGIA
ncbi:MAG TPA: hypothetical protein VEU29_06830 [Actinomycetota bacterium]|nr:hypothetical protein [Actinomycetota bacterium]